MKLSTLLILSAAALCQANPVSAPKRIVTGSAQFFWDTKCQLPAATVAVDPQVFQPGQLIGGPYGSRSASFKEAGTLIGFSIVEAGDPKDKGTWQMHPQTGVGHCVGTERGGGVYATYYTYAFLPTGPVR